MTLISRLIDIPTEVHDGDFVLRLTRGVEAADNTLGQYVVTDQLAQSFDDALGMIGGAIRTGESRAAYLHGSFGSGKSHFMAVLHLVLGGNPDARKLLDSVVVRHDAELAGRSVLLVPFHFLGASSIESAVFSGYVNHVRTLHPDADLPPVYLGSQIVDAAVSLRTKMGDDAFFAVLSGRSAAGAPAFAGRISGEAPGEHRGATDESPVSGEAAEDDDSWGDFDAGVWDAARFDSAIGAAPTHADQRDLVAAYLRHLAVDLPGRAAASGEGFVSIDDGLSAISRHARDLGYDAVVFFLDELILWLAQHAADVAFVKREGQKLTKLVESSNADRPVPIVSFVARQRDLRELIGDQVPGIEAVTFSDTVDYQSGRFQVITLEDRNLAEIAHRRLLAPRDDEAAAVLRDAFAQATADPEVLRGLLTSDSDRGLFELVYPFSPALVQGLVAVSAALQRQRTALKVMLSMLVDRRDDLEVGQLIPVGDLYDAIDARDEPFSPEMKAHFAKAQKLYGSKIRPLLLAEHDLSVDAARTVADDHRFRTDDRLAKTLLLAALVPDCEAFANLSARRLAVLNYGTIKTRIPGGEVAAVLAKLRRWAGQIGELTVGDDQNDPLVALTLVGVDTDSITDRARHLDNAGLRRRSVQRRLGELLTGGEIGSTHELDWRGGARSIDVVFGNIRKPDEIPDSVLTAGPDRPKLVIDFPFDPEGRGPADDTARADQYRSAHDPTRTLCWVPSFLSAGANDELGDLVVLEELLKGDRYDQYTDHLTLNQRIEARPLLESRRSHLRERLDRALAMAYGAVPASGDLIDSAKSLADHFEALDTSMSIAPPTVPNLSGAIDDLAGQLLAHQHPAAPSIAGARVRPATIRAVWEEIGRALGTPDRRVVIDPKHRSAMADVAQPLGLGEMHESHFIASRHWETELGRRLGEVDVVTVGTARAWLEQPESRGLPEPVADLIVMVFAALTDHSFTYGGNAFEPTPGKRMPDEVQLRKEDLPSAEIWSRAVGRAGALFGVNGSSLVTAGSVATLTSEVAGCAAARAGDVNRCVHQLGPVLSRLELGADVDRMATLTAAGDLLAGVGVDNSRALVERLASAPLPAADEVIAQVIARAGAVADQLSATNWRLLEGARHRGPEGAALWERVREAVSHHEVTVPLVAALEAAVYESTGLMIDPTPTPAPVPMPVPAQSPAPAPAAAPAPANVVIDPDSDPMLVGTPADHHGSIVVCGQAELDALVARLERAIAASPAGSIRVDWTTNR